VLEDGNSYSTFRPREAKKKRFLLRGRGKKKIFSVLALAGQGDEGQGKGKGVSPIQRHRTEQTLAVLNPTKLNYRSSSSRLPVPRLQYGVFRVAGGQMPSWQGGKRALNGLLMDYMAIIPLDVVVREIRVWAVDWTDY
jgi:hypothetical protein